MKVGDGQGIGWRRVLRGAVLGCLAAAVWAAAGRGDDPQDRARINAALASWIGLIEQDRPYLVLDLDALEVRLEHGGARLRNCPLEAARLDTLRGPVVELERRIRLYRPSHAGAPIAEGPFDWEQHLARDGDGRCALYFAGGLLLYADAFWERAAPPQVRLRAADLRALYNALEPGAAMVVLPAGWKRGRADGRK